MTPSPRDIYDRLIAVAEPVCSSNGYELVDVDYESGQGGWVVRFYIDHAPGHVSGLAGGISFADCETLSRELGAVLDVEDPVPHAYSLEISSPGVARPLRTAAHFRQQVGQTAKIELDRGLDGRRNFKGTIVAAGDASVTVEVDGQRFELPLADLDKARLVPDWDAVLRGKDAQGQKDRAKGRPGTKSKSSRKPKAGETPEPPAHD